VNIAGFTERVLDERREGDNREDYQLSGTTRIAIREKQFHNLLVRYGMTRTSPRGEFFTGPLSAAKRALKATGTGDYYSFSGNTEPVKITLTRADEVETSQVKLRESPRLLEVAASTKVVDKLAEGDAPTVLALEKLREVRHSPRLSGTSTPMTVSVTSADMQRIRTDPQLAAALTKLANVRPVRRSKRLAEKNKAA
jgi:hypothetical protein